MSKKFRAINQGMAKANKMFLKHKGPRPNHQAKTAKSLKLKPRGKK